MHRYAKSIRRLITFYSIFLQKFRKIKECFETQASNLFVLQKLREIKEYFASAAFFLISKISWNHSTQEVYSHPHSVEKREILSHQNVSSNQQFSNL